MKLVPIFDNSETGEGLYAIHFDKQELDEFERLFDNWSDMQYLTNYFEANLKYLTETHFDGITVDQVITKVQNEASNLEQLLYSYCHEGFDKEGKNLQMLFQPLENREHRLIEKQESKARTNDRKPILRVYAIRIDVNTYVVTGGAIKLTHEMKDHEDTASELNKLTQVKAFLNANEIHTVDDIIYYYEES